MANFYELVLRGGPVMIPIVGLSVVTIACGFERAWFWTKVFQGESQISGRILAAADYSFLEALELAKSAQAMPIGRFLLAGLRLHQPAPDTFSLALESAGEKEFAQMRRGRQTARNHDRHCAVVGVARNRDGIDDHLRKP